MNRHPDQVLHYLGYADIRSRAHRNGCIDLGDVSFLTPTTLLPLSITLRKLGDDVTIVPPPDPNVASYLRIMVGEHGFNALNRSTYLPVVGLPKDENRSHPILRKIYELSGDPGGRNAFRYLVGEMVDNIYQHSGFHDSLVMAQQYRKSGEMHLCIVDDGITIPGSLRSSGISLEDDQAIIDAIEGASAKREPERGRGLGTSLHLTVAGYGGSALVVSGYGAVYCDRDRCQRYRLSDKNKFEGTLISMKIPLTTEEIDLYEHVVL
ncbi:MAG: hypothetical protein A4E29_00923 [Methanomassiliicoccales archaeon PtaB.Bin134]|nr:MAG: hypothetical protein A4E29_00923 [Methanomassiliicoccales archaeon PtaB.Bin134]